MNSIQDTTNKKNLYLLIQLRWLAVIGQVVTILFVDLVLGIPLPLIEMAVVIAFLVALNVVSLLRHRNQDAVSNTELFLELLLDVAALTVQLYLSGGASNPFIYLYLLQVIIGAVLLETWSIWTLLAITSACFIGLTTYNRPIALPRQTSSDLTNLQTQGLFICFVLAAILLVFFVTRIDRNLRARDAHLASLRQQSAEEDHIVRMGLLASGAAHELGTPLATLSVILSDWQRMPLFKADSEVTQELQEMRSQLDRCKAIVTGILMSSGEMRGEGTLRTSVNIFFDGLAEEWRAHRSPAWFDYENVFGADAAIVSDSALKQIVFNLFDNALEASASWVGVTLERRDDMIALQVRDAGPGFAKEMLDQFGKPYNSSKNRPGGGLGLFLVVNVVRKLGGTVTAGNEITGGARVELTLPLASLSPGEAGEADGA
ncbi:two-component sensor histidine kinase [Labrys miyagiensis]|uniref:histidine kinase n=1 Tax=Labrys miyagiensis TaxID=346912 RepID=A0ABQ6CKD8_9HYPH|nr:ATP-binding protein [Labrys miyagiensis]GLS20822.1 two-component sensor histidine kinase [Labrys miyagiensis]